MVAKKLPAQENTQQGVQSILVSDAIETNFIGKCAQYRAFKFISEVG